MTKLYLLIAICVFILMTYAYGYNSGHNKCIQQIAIQNSEISAQQNIKKEKINAEIYRTSTNNIRDILRTKYTITD